MKAKYFGLFLLFSILAAPFSVAAHHGAASFDTTVEVTLKGTVTEWQWFNPHCFLKFDVKGPDGTVRTWTTETSNPPDMVNRGWNRRSLNPGDRVTVTVEPVKSGSPVGRLLEVTLADGRVLSARGGGVTAAPGRQGGTPQ